MAARYLVTLPFIYACDRLPTHQHFLTLCMIFKSMSPSPRAPHSDMLSIYIPFGSFVVDRVMFNVLPSTHVKFYLLKSLWNRMYETSDGCNQPITSFEDVG